MESDRTVGLILDFDASRSVVKAGKSGKWLLKPTIKVTGTVNNATFTGAVIDESLEACGVKSRQEAEELVAQARARANLTEDEAVDLAVRETSVVRRVRVLRETGSA